MAFLKSFKVTVPTWLAVKRDAKARRWCRGLRVRVGPTMTEVSFGIR